MARRIAGAEMIDPVWRGMVQWHAVTNTDFARADAQGPDGGDRKPAQWRRSGAPLRRIRAQAGRVMKEFKGKTAFVTGGASGSDFRWRVRSAAPA
jgi:hypothetical protein